MDGAIKKLFNGEKLTRNDYIAIKNSYSDHVAEFNPATPLACRKCLDVEKRFRYKVIESIRSYVKSQRLVSSLVHIDMKYYFLNYKRAPYCSIINFNHENVV